MNLVPFLTEVDPVSSSEGSLDPLGLYPIADALGVRLIPGVRERQRSPRFLTAIAVSLSICSEFEEGTLAKDGVSEPWQVFEWYMVEGLVRTTNDGTLKGLPGRDKTIATINDGMHLSAGRYLKNAFIMGFHGIYRILSRKLGIEVAERLGDFGYELLTTWADEQGLKGFCGTVPGEGRQWRESMASAVKDGLTKGAADRSPFWPGWAFFKRHLSHHEPGPNETAVIARGLFDPEQGFRRPVLDFLISPEGDNIWRNTNSEREFHSALASRCDSSLKELLTTILAYENFSRLLFNAFEDCLFVMSKTRRKTFPAELQTLPSVIKANRQIPSLFGELIERLSPLGESIRFQETFSSVAERTDAEEWVRILIDHHRTIQHHKPPNGKTPWFETFDDGACLIRPLYARNKDSDTSEDYVNAYRTEPLWSFASDLGLVK